LLRYFVLPDTAMGALAEQTVVDLRRSIVLPEGSDPILVAAGMNPAMSSWVALRRRITFRPGQSVLVLGATGNAGQLAVQVAKHAGAGLVIGAGRDARRLEALAELGADQTVTLEGPDAAGRLGAAARNVDVVLDYLWGQPAADAIRALATDRADASQPLVWVQIGSVAGPSAAVPSAALRATRLQIVGSGQGSVGTGEILAELDALAELVSRGTFQIAPRTVPLRDIGPVWEEARTSRRRIVVTP
jgi:NADPH:quinone reductase-like Zn-dependent oxidoreductase